MSSDTNNFSLESEDQMKENEKASLLSAFKNIYNSTAATIIQVQRIYHNSFNQYKKVKQILDTKAIDQRYTEISNYVNKEHEYAAMLLRTHGELIRWSATVAIGVPSLLINRRLFILSSLITYGSSSFAIYVTEYKWKNSAK